MTASEIRRKARESLAGKWGKGVCIVLAYLLVNFVIGFVIGLFDEESIIRNLLEIAQVIVSIPISLGFAFSFIKLKRNEEIGAFDFLKIGFQNFGRAWKLDLRIFLKMILPIIGIVIGIIFISTSIFGAAAEMYGILNAGIDIGALSVLFYLGIIIYIVAIVFTVIIGLLYSLVFMIAYDNPDMTSLEVVNKSAELMRGNRGKYFVLTLSFLGWAILGIFTLGIGYLWLIPYIQIAGVCFYDELLGLNESKNTEEIKAE